METTYVFKQLSTADTDRIRELFCSIFTAEPWNDDWSDEEQLRLYLHDLTGQENSLTYGLFEKDELIGISMGHTKHWYTGTEYCIDEFGIRTDRQGQGAGTYFMKEIETEIRRLGMTHIFLLTESDVPAYDFYRKNGFYKLPKNVALAKRIR